MYNNLKGFDDKSNNYNVKYRKKHVFSLKNNPMSGINFSQWFEILRKYGKYIEFIYYFRALFITCISIFNSFLSIIEDLLYSKSIESAIIPNDPIFLLGHPRTGTTLLHNLLSSDVENYYFCSTFCAGFPNCFLWFEPFKFLFQGILEKTRPMDSMPLHFDLPQEDELATNLLSCGTSYYMPLYFMKQETLFRKYFSFNSDQGSTQKDEDKWSKSFLYLIRKLVVRENKSNVDKKNRRLVIKSPVHTARVPLLKKLFPNAKFIYIHRHPYEIYQSASHMADTTYWYCYLNSPSNDQINEFILWQFEYMWQNYNDACYNNKFKKNIDEFHNRIDISSDIIEISYKDLLNDSIKNIEKVYNHVNITWKEKQIIHYKEQLQAISTYKPNDHNIISNELKEIIYNRWKEYFISFNYKK